MRQPIDKIAGDFDFRILRRGEIVTLRVTNPDVRGPICVFLGYTSEETFRICAIYVCDGDFSANSTVECHHPCCIDNFFCFLEVQRLAFCSEVRLELLLGWDTTQLCKSVSS